MPRGCRGGRIITMETPPLIYIECEIPAGVTLDEYRRSQVSRTGRRSRGWRRLLAL